MNKDILFGADKRAHIIIYKHMLKVYNPYFDARFIPYNEISDIYHKKARITLGIIKILIEGESAVKMGSWKAMKDPRAFDYQPLTRGVNEFVERIRKNIFESQKKYIQNDKFIPEKELQFGFINFMMNETTQQWTAYGKSTKEIKIYNYSDLLEFEVFENGSSIAHGSAGSALVGGLLFGTVGAIVGSSIANSATATCTDFQLRIRVKNFSNPEIIIDLISGSDVPKVCEGYKIVTEFARKVVTNLTYIQNKNDSSVKSTTILNDIGIEERLKELVKLKNSGLITETEYQSKRGKIIEEL